MTGDDMSNIRTPSTNIQMKGPSSTLNLPPTAGVRFLTRNGVEPVRYRQASNARSPSRQDLECRSSLSLGRSKLSVGRALELRGPYNYAAGARRVAGRNAKWRRERGIE